MPTLTLTYLTGELSELTANWPKKVYSYCPPAAVLVDSANDAFLYQWYRLSLGVGIEIHASPQVATSSINGLVRIIDGGANPVLTGARIMLTGEPYSQVPGSDDPYNWGAEHDAEVAYWMDALADTVQYLLTAQAAASPAQTNAVDLIFLRAMQADMQVNGNRDHDYAVRAKYDVMTASLLDVCRDELGYEPAIVWYGHYAARLHEEHTGLWHTNIGPHPGSIATHGCCPLYFNDDPHLNIEVFNRSLTNSRNNGIHQCVPVFCPAGGYWHDYLDRVDAEASGWTATQEHARLSSWLAGNTFMQASGRTTTDETGMFAYAPFAVLRPGPLQSGWKYQPTHLVAFAHGCANLEELPVGEPP